jgi:uncharacterized membrane protein YfcA
MIGSWILLLTCGYVAATISGAAGFGGALILLPVIVFVVGGKPAVPILTVAQLLGNAARAGFGWREIRWRPALLFSLGAIPASLLGARLFVGLNSAIVPRLLGSFLLLIVALRHTSLGSRRIPEQLLAPAGAAVAFVSAIAGSAGPLGAAVFLSLKLPAQAYVASEAVTAVLMHATKSLVYGKYAALRMSELAGGLLLGSALVAGSWTGRQVIARLPERAFRVLVEALLVISAGVLFLSGP